MDLPYHKNQFDQYCSTYYSTVELVLVGRSVHEPCY